MNKFLLNKGILSILATLLFLNINVAWAGFTVRSSTTIIGNAPQFSSAIEQEIADNNFSLLGFTYNGKNIYPSNLSELAIMPAVAKMTSFSIAPIPTLELGQANDIDGDSDFILSTPNNLQLKVKANGLDFTGLDSTFCSLMSSYKGPYTIEISGDIKLSTKYGDPLSRDYRPLTKITLPFAGGICSAMPNIKPTFSGVNDPLVWTLTKGFSVVSDTNTGLNFPTTGFNNAVFYLPVVGININSVEWEVLYPDGGAANVTATVDASGSDNRLKVTLNGPTAETKGAFDAPRRIRIADKGNQGIYYEFIIAKWYVPQTEQSGGYVNAQPFCDSLPNYRLPARNDLTTNTEVSGGSLIRLINGQLFSEWGDFGDVGYPNSGFTNIGYWTTDTISEGRRLIVTSLSGSIGNPVETTESVRTVCVSP